MLKMRYLFRVEKFIGINMQKEIILRLHVYDCSSSCFTTCKSMSKQTSLHCVHNYGTFKSRKIAILIITQMF